MLCSGYRVVMATWHRLFVSCRPATGDDLEADEVVWCTQAGTQDWLAGTGLELHDGFIAVDDNLQSVNTPDVFACGDVALMVNHPRPRAGVFAVRQGPPLALNIRHKLAGA